MMRLVYSFQPMSPQELWQWVHYSYGDDLGLTSSDDDYIAPTQDDEEKFQKILTQDEMNESQDKVGHVLTFHLFTNFSKNVSKCLYQARPVAGPVFSLCMIHT